MRAREVGRQGHGYAPTALAETENLSEPRPTYLHDIAQSPPRSSVAPRTYEAPLRTWTDALAFFIFAALIVATAFITLYALIAVLFILGQTVTP